MNDLLKIAGAGIALFAIVRLASAARAGNITAKTLTVDKTTCPQSPCTVSGSVTWENIGEKPETFVPKVVSGTGTVLASQPEQTLQAGAEYTMPFSVQITELTQFCPDPN